MIHGIIQEPFAIGDYGGSTRLLPLLQLPFSWLFPVDVLGVRLPGVMVTLLGGIIIFTLTCSLLGATTGFVCGALYLLHPLIWFQARSELLIAMTPVLVAPCIWYLVRQLGAHSRLELAEMGFIAGFSLWFHQAAPLAWLVAWVSRGIAQILSGASRTTTRDFLSESSWLALGALVSSSPQVIFAGHMISARTGTMATDLSLPLILEKYLGFLEAFYKPVFAGFHAPVLPVGFTAGLAGLFLLILAILILIKTQSISRVATSSLFLWIVVSGFSHRVLTSGPLAPHRLIFVIVPLVCLIGFGLTSPRLFRPLHGRETPPSSMVRYTASFALVWFLGFIPLSIHIFRASHTEQNLDQLRLLSSGLARATANKSVSLTYPMCIFVPNHAVASAFSFGHVHEQFRYFINPKALFEVRIAPDKLPTPYSVAIGDCNKDIPLTMELYGSWRQWQFFCKK